MSGPPEWIKFVAGLILSAIASGAGTISYLYATFENKESARDRGHALEKRLDRIETKIDNLIDASR